MALSSWGLAIAVTVLVFWALSITTCIVRLCVRRLTRALGWDDFVVLIFTVLGNYQLLIVVAAFSGFGRHENELSTSQKEHIIFYTWLLQFFLYLVLPLPKIAICLFILRIKSGKWLRFLLYALIAGLVATDLACWIILLAQCRPVQAAWNPAAGTCWTFNIYNTSLWIAVGYSIFSDLVCTSLPVFILWNVQMTRRTKAQVCGLMSLGLFATIAAVLRAWQAGANNGNPDATHALCAVALLAILEVDFAILGANLALSRYYVSYFRGKLGRKKSFEPQRDRSDEVRLRQVSDPLSSTATQTTYTEAYVERRDEVSVMEESNKHQDISRERFIGVYGETKSWAESPKG